MLLLNKIRRFMAGTSESALVIVVLLVASAASSFGLGAAPAAMSQGQIPPKTWIDADTGHRVTRLSEEPNSKGLYFNLNAYTRDGLDMIYISPKGIHDLNLSTLESNLLVGGRVDNIIVGTKTRKVFFMKHGDRHVYVVDIDSKQVTQLAALPVRGIVSTVNADETLLAGTYLEGTAPDFIQYKLQAVIDAHNAAISHPKEKASATPTEVAMEKRWASHAPEDMFTVNLQTRQVKVILRGTDWLNHVQFSPTDPTLIMYAHEGPSLKVDRIWTIRADGSQNQLIHKRTAPTESATHEFWSKDGKTIWFDLHKSKGQSFALAGYDVATAKLRLFQLEKTESSKHFSAASDSSFFCGEGSKHAPGPAGPAHGGKGKHGQKISSKQWIEALYPTSGADSQHAGSFRSEHLVNMGKHSYDKIEPNVRLSPDNKLLIFTSNMFGPSYVFAVEVNSSVTAPTKN